ncbi:MAG: beta-propeller domain-containing protein [Bacillota bacterium]
MNKRILLGLIVAVFLAAVAVAALPVLPAASVAQRLPRPAAAEPKTFASYSELVSYIKQHTASARRLGWHGILPLAGEWVAADRIAAGESMAMKAAEGSPAMQATPEMPRDYSATNVQVAGVDEADVVKTDGNHLYVLSGNEVVILKAYPPESARVLSRIDFPGAPAEAFIARNRLMVLGTKAETGDLLIRVYDVSDKEKPVLKKELTSPGRCVTSRLIGDYAYVIVNAPVYGTDKSGTNQVVLPKIKVNGRERTVSPTRVHYFDVPDYDFQYTVILSVNLQDENKPVTEKTFLTGVSQNVFASQEHIYLTARKMPDLERQSDGFFQRLLPALPAGLRDAMIPIRDSKADFATKLSRAESAVDEYLNKLDPGAAPALINRITVSYEKWQQDLAREHDRTVIHKLAVAGGSVTYLCKGEVPGQVLNQFSMDEHQGFFRIATTAEGFSFSGPWVTRNNVYVLDENMRITGRLEGLAAGERIYAARFMGKRCYLVTFRQVDPLLVIDLEDPREPKLLGELKIPGYSNYLHPYDDHHLIGIGKEVVAEPVPLPAVVPGRTVGAPVPMRADQAAGGAGVAGPGGTVGPPVRVIPPTREMGIKVALFDVTDPTRPKETAKYVIEGWSVDSPALHDHKAILFSKPKNLLAFPVSFQPVYRETDGMPLYRQWQGAYVFDISPKGIHLRGTVKHGPDNHPDFPDYDCPVKRCLYIENVFYSVSERMVKANDLNTLKEINRILW